MVRARGAAAQHAETGPGRGMVGRKAPVRVRGEKRSLSQSERLWCRLLLIIMRNGVDRFVQ